MQNSEPAVAAVSNTSIPLHQVEWKNDAPVSNSVANSMIHLYTKSILVNSHHLMGDLSSNFNHHPIDPGHIHANRLANYSTLDNTLFFINHKKLFKIRYELPSEAKWRATKNEKLPYPIPLSEIDMACVYEGQEQFQDVEIDGHRMGVCDEVGNVHVLERDASLLGHVDDEEDGARGKKRKLDASSIVKLPYNVGGEETTIRGHCSMRFHPRDEHIIFRSKFSTKHVTIFDMNKNATVFNIHTLQNPTKIKTFEMDNSSSPLLAIGEYNNVSIWDLRTNKSVERLTRTRGIVYDLEVCHTGNTDNKFKSSNLLGTVGSDRTVYVYDTKKWSPVHKWQNCLKYAPSYLSFSNVNKELCYVAGFDNSEFKCGNFMDQKKQRKGRGHGLYADNRWIGMTKVNRESNNDTVVGMSMNGSVYVLEHPNRMAPSDTDLETVTENMEE